MIARLFLASLGSLALLVSACASSDGGAPPSSSSGGAPAAPAPPSGESPASKERPKDLGTWVGVGIDGDAFEPSGYRLTHLHIVARVDGLIAADEKILASAGPLFPREVRLVAPKDKPDAVIELDVTAWMNEAEVVKRSLRARFVPGAKKLAYLRLEVGCNTMQLLGGGGPSGPTCGAAETCIAGKCRSPEMTALPDYRADWAESPPSACGDGAAAELTLGQGEKTFAPLAEGETVTLERGPQCGHHAWLSLRMKNLSQWKTITTLTAVQPGTAVTVPATGYPSAWSESAGGTCEIDGVRFQLDIGTSATAFLGKPLDITVRAKDGAGRAAEVTRRVQIANAISNPTGRPCGD